MSRLVFLFLFLVASLGYIFEVDKVVARNISNPFDFVKEFYLDGAKYIKETKEKYFSQVVTIETLQEENKELRSYKIKYDSTKKEVETILQNLENTNFTTKRVQFARVLSYIDFDDYTKVWLDLEKKDNTILGVIADEYAAGIVVNQEGKSKALLNGNEKCNYAIYVGDKKAPGIIHASKNGHYLLAKFIPIWFDIKEGDEVITSGMDNIFFEGLKVGKVVSIKKKQDIQEATIMPYAKVLKEKTFFVYKAIPKEKVKKEVKKIESKPEEKKATNKKP